MDLRPLSDDALYSRLEALAACEREALVDVVEHLLEADRRGYSSLYDYCRRRLGYSEFGALARIRAARACGAHADVLPKLRSGALNLDAIARLYPHLTEANSKAVLEKASGATTQAVKALVVDLKGPQAPVRDRVEPLSSVAPASLPLAPAGQPEVIPPPRRILIQFEADEKLLSKIDRLKSLLRNKYPFARLEEVFGDAADALLARVDPDRKTLRNCGQPQLRSAHPDVAAGSDRSRWIPVAVKRLVWARDGGRCAYVAEGGLRCESVDALQYDHITPFALGGVSDDPANIRLLCRPHNQWLARRRFGPRPPKKPGPA